MQHERHPLGGRQRLQHHEQRETNRIGQQRLLLDPLLAADGQLARRKRLHVERLLAPRLAPAQHVQAHPRHHRGQPPRQVFDVSRLGAAEPQPGLLHRIVRLAERAEHPIGDLLQPVPVGLELFRQPIFLVHRSRSPGRVSSRL
jgi:hypothetical protein